MLPAFIKKNNRRPFTGANRSHALPNRAGRFPLAVARDHLNQAIPLTAFNALVKNGLHTLSKMNQRRRERLFAHVVAGHATIRENANDAALCSDFGMIRIASNARSFREVQSLLDHELV